MKLEEAIKRIKVVRTRFSIKLTCAEVDALFLGIEALKREKQRRDHPEFIICELLPGETEE